MSEVVFPFIQSLADYVLFLTKTFGGVYTTIAKLVNRYTSSPSQPLFGLVTAAKETMIDNDTTSEQLLPVTRLSRTQSRDRDS